MSFEVDRIDEAMSEGWSVLVSGRAQRVEDRTEIEKLASVGIEPWAGGKREAVIRIEINEISGRAIRQQPTQTPRSELGRRGDLSEGRGGRAATANTDDLAHLVTRLRVIVNALSLHLPDPSDGVAWVHFDTALSDLHGALIALGDVHEGSASGSTLLSHPGPRPRVVGEVGGSRRGGGRRPIPLLEKGLTLPDPRRCPESDGLGPEAPERPLVAGAALSHTVPGSRPLPSPQPVVERHAPTDPFTPLEGETEKP